jgi:hypothetical protein
MKFAPKEATRAHETLNFTERQLQSVGCAAKAAAVNCFAPLEVICVEILIAPDAPLGMIIVFVAVSIFVQGFPLSITELIS